MHTSVHYSIRCEAREAEVKMQDIQIYTAYLRLQSEPPPICYSGDGINCCVTCCYASSKLINGCSCASPYEKKSEARAFDLSARGSLPFASRGCIKQSRICLIDRS